ncbi:MAG: transcription termination/antitermination factor NusG [Spirochaetales bacterium]|nr:transcription termination/antitermination factor NusG [Leptospiraceae bacterium]MCP5480092.1 transcription termination/antitermination factor NusG [Spirochaetales bacterium]MCP5485568.1 transcription termination/antitermination factor NusG [Spirochaetales bacterium]
MAFKWYVIRTYSGHENKVKTNLDKIVQSRGMQDRIGQVNIPTIKVAEMKNGKKRVVEKKFMPGYILAELALDDEIQYMISRLPSVAGFVGSPEPEPLSEEEVRNLLQGEVSSEEEEAPVAHILFQLGERVKIVDGPFANFTGVVDEIFPDKGRLRVKVEIFGQATPVELDYLQVASNVG